MHDAPELRDFLVPVLGDDDPIVIRMRHEPTPASARLLVSLGAGWVVDARAPVCVRRCGRPECREVIVKVRTGATAERLALAERVRLLRQEGLTHDAVALRLGISRSYASELYLDPDGSAGRARKDSYTGVCGCGAPTSGSNGHGQAPERCESCRREQQHDERIWTRTSIIETFQRFCEITGRAPTATEVTGLFPSQRKRLSIERQAEIDAAPRLPHPAMVRREFGSWRAAVLAAGLTPAASGTLGHRGHRRLSPAALATLQLLEEGPSTIHALAAQRQVLSRTQFALVAGLMERGLVVRLSRGLYGLADPLNLELKEKIVAREYVVLAKNSNGYLPLDTVEAVNPAHAIEKVATTEGTFVAVPVAHWQEETVAPSRASRS